MKKSLTTLLRTLAVTALCSGAAHAQTSYQLVWADEFHGSISPDWRFETGGGGWGNNEKQYYQRSNATVVDDNLLITAKRENMGGLPYTSSRMITAGMKSFTYGKMEARIKLPLGQGLWPAFWMLGDNIGSVGWPRCGEIDILEQVNTDSRTYGTVHWDNNGHAEYGKSTPMSPNVYHVYGIEWDATSIRWYLDGAKYNEISIANGVGGTEEFQKPFFLLLNMAVAGNWPGQTVDESKLPATMFVDYVRVYQQLPNNNPPPPVNPPPATGVTNLSGIYKLQNRNSGLFLDVDGAGQADRTPLLQWTGNDCACQQFRFTHLGGGAYKIEAVHSGKGLDVNEISTADGAGIVQWPYVGGANQQFVVQDAGGGFFKLRAKHSGKVVEVASSSRDLRARVQQWTDNNSATQQWKLIPGGNTPPPPVAFSRLLEAEAHSLNNGMVAEGCSEGGQNMGYVDNGDYLVFNAINFPTSGSYLVEYRIASGTGGGTVSCDLNGGSIQLGTTTVPGTGGWQTWRTVSRTVTVNAGTYNFGIYATTGGWNLNWIRITKVGGRSAASAKADASTQLTVYPNPVVDQLTVSGAEAGSAYRILNALGQRVAGGTLEASHTVNVAALRAGMYTLVITAKDQTTATTRFSK